MFQVSRLGCKVGQGFSTRPLSSPHRSQRRTMPLLHRQSDSDFWRLSPAYLFVFLLAASAAAVSQGQLQHANYNPVSLLSTCIPSPSLSWSTAPSSPPSLAVEFSSICPWQCDTASPLSHLHPHGVLLSLSASVSSPCDSNQNCQNDRDSVFITADASPLPLPPHVPVSCSALSLPVIFMLTFPPHDSILSSNPSLITLCITGRALAPPHNVTYLPPCTSTTLPPHLPPPPTHLSPLLVCSIHPSYACNPVSFFVSQGGGRLIQKGSHGIFQTATQEEAILNTDNIAPYLIMQSEFNVAFQLGRAGVTGCARLLLLPPPHHTHYSPSPAPLFASSDLHLPATETHFPFRFTLNVSLQLQAPMFDADGASGFCAKALLHFWFFAFAGDWAMLHHSAH
jgi:hypothetical protein